MADCYLVASERLLGVRTNVPHLRWSFGSATPHSTKNEYASCLVRLQFSVEPVELPSSQNGLGKYHYFTARPESDCVYYDRPWLLGSRLRVKANNLLSGAPSLSINGTYHRWVTHRVMNLHSAAYILTDLAAILLLRQGFAPIHCSAFRKGDATVLVMAPPNAGKTLSAMTACLEHGARYIAEDFAVTDGTTIHSVPWTSTFRYYPQIDRTTLTKALKAIRKVLPVIELFSLQRPRPITGFLESGSIITQSEITHLVVLERGDPAVQPLDLDEAHRLASNLNRYELNYRRSPLVLAYEFFNPALDVEAAYQTEQRILRTVAANAKHRLLVRRPHPSDYASAIMNLIE